MAFRFFALIALLAGLIGGLIGGLAGVATAQQPPVSAADSQAIRDIIQNQVDAFRRDDGAAAFGYASPDIQRLFGAPEIFLDMVRQGYRPVYRPRVFEFAEIVLLNGQPTQKVRVVGPDGRPVNAFYPMMQLPDGSWRVDGCYLQAPEDHQA